MKKIITVLGARPQFIKASALSREFSKSKIMQEIVVHTGQHFDENMSDIFFQELGMKRPEYFLNIHGGTHGNMTGRMLMEIERVMIAEKPDLVLVYGDTNSTLSGALAASKLHIPVAHVEAGLRSFNMKMPEEINRILTDRISSFLFAPTEVSEKNLNNEGYDRKNIHMVGDVMYDVALHFGRKVNESDGLMAKLNLKSKEYILATVHRAENTDDLDRLNVIVQALMQTSKNIEVVWPLHPRTKNVIEKMGVFESLSSCVKIIDPVGYMDMIQLEKYAALIATDSGGVQKEAYFYKVPCITLRDETEWVELVQNKWNKLSSPNDVVQLTKDIESSMTSKGLERDLYGDGRASKKIMEVIEEAFV